MQSKIYQTMTKTPLILIISVSIFASCSNTSENNVRETLLVATYTATLKYQCPMNCQSDTAYTSAGQCPVCEMDLEK